MEKKGRGFAGMDTEAQRKISSMGGKAAHAAGTAHEFNSEEAREAGRKGGAASGKKRWEKEQEVPTKTTNIKTTAERNAEFEAMTPQQKRVTLAQDVLAQMAAGRFIATRGTYLEPDGGGSLAEEDADKDLSEILVDVETCDVCAIGSLFFCAVMRADKIKVGNKERITKYGARLRDLGYDYHTYLEQFFDAFTAEAIECLFESGYCYDKYGRYRSVPESASRNADSRMTWLMQNIAANNGQLVYDWVAPTMGEQTTVGA